MTTKIPAAVVLVVGDTIGSYYYSHRKLNALFGEANAPGDPPLGNCSEKCQAWLRRANDESPDPLRVLGAVMLELMEGEPEPDMFGREPDANPMLRARERIQASLTKGGLVYVTGGYVTVAGATSSTRAIESILRERDLRAVDEEFQRAVANLTTDPPAAATAACAILESLFKVIIVEEHLEMPSKETVSPLWHVVKQHLGLNARTTHDEDLQRVLGGLSQIVEGLGAFRTHQGSAHGRGVESYRATETQARLVVSAAHTLVVFVIETWDARARG